MSNIDVILDKFDNGRELFQNSPRFKAMVMELEQGADVYKMMEQMFIAEAAATLAAAVKRRKAVDQMTKEGVYIKTFDSATDASNELKIDRSGITHCCAGDVKTAGGYKWCFSEIKKN